MRKGPGGGSDTDDWCCPASQGEDSADAKVTRSTSAPCTAVPSDHPASAGAPSSRHVPIIFLGRKVGKKYLVEARVGPPSLPQHPRPDVP